MADVAAEELLGDIIQIQFRIDLLLFNTAL
jgi:hypothetical protein